MGSALAPSGPDNKRGCCESRGAGRKRGTGAVLTHWLPWLLWPVVRHLCGLCFPQWGRGWTLLRPLLKDGEECGGRLTGAGTARHPTTGALCGRRAVSGWCGPSGLRSPPACYGTAGEFPPTLASFTPAGTRPGYGGEGDHEDTEQGSHIQLSIQAPATWAHTILPFCSERVPRDPGSRQGSEGGGLEALIPGQLSLPGSSLQPTGPALGPLP